MSIFGFCVFPADIDEATEYGFDFAHLLAALVSSWYPHLVQETPLQQAEPFLSNVLKVPGRKRSGYSTAAFCRTTGELPKKTSTPAFTFCSTFCMFPSWSRLQYFHHQSSFAAQPFAVPQALSPPPHGPLSSSSISPPKSLPLSGSLLAECIRSLTAYQYVNSRSRSVDES